MFRAPVLVHWLNLGLGWAWIKLSPVDKFGKLNLDEAWLGLARLEALLRGTLPIFGINVSRTCPCTLAWLRLGLGWAWAGLGSTVSFR